MKPTWNIFVSMIVGAVWCGLAHPAVAVQQDFDAFPTNTPLNSLPGWQAPPDHVIRKTSLINIITTNGAGYANVGYTNQGVEAYVHDSQFPTNALQEGSLWTVPAANALTQNGGVFQFNVRLSSYFYDGTNLNNTGGAGAGFLFLVGSGMQYQTNNLTGETWVVWTNAQAFGVYMINNGSDNYIYWNSPDFDDSIHGTPGFSASLSAGYIYNWNRRIILPWSQDIYYTVQISNIVFNSSICTQATAILNVWETDNGFVVTNNVLLRGHAGNAPLLTQPFTNINQMSFAVSRLNAVDQYDHILLAPPSVASPPVLQIKSIVRQGTDINLSWLTGTAGGQTNAVQVTSGDANGNYLTNGFADIATLVIPSPGLVLTNFVDVGAATNKPSRYYRVRLVP